MVERKQDLRGTSGPKTQIRKVPNLQNITLNNVQTIRKSADDLFVRRS